MLWVVVGSFCVVLVLCFRLWCFVIFASFCFGGSAFFGLFVLCLLLCGFVFVLFFFWDGFFRFGLCGVFFVGCVVLFIFVGLLSLWCFAFRGFFVLVWRFYLFFFFCSVWRWFFFSAGVLWLWWLVVWFFSFLGCVLCVFCFSFFGFTLLLLWAVCLDFGGLVVFFLSLGGWFGL